MVHGDYNDMWYFLLVNNACVSERERERERERWIWNLTLLNFLQADKNCTDSESEFFQSQVSFKFFIAW